MATHQAGAPGASPQATPEKLPGIRHIVAIGSGKGGVGKSTVSVNLALVLQRLGGRIGLVDADVLVPSIPACSALADFQRTTRGTATQTIKALVASGHLRTQRSKSDGRSVQLQLTARGRKTVAHDPFEVLVRAIAALDSQRRAGLYTGLQQVLAAVDGDGAHRRFGVCRDCAYIGGDVCCNLKGIRAPALECLLLGVPMPPEEAELLCVKFRPKFAPT